jgi:hypothetical protein
LTNRHLEVELPQLDSEAYILSSTASLGKTSLKIVLQLGIDQATLTSKRKVFVSF